MDIQDLKPFDKYIVATDRLLNCYYNSKTVFEQEKWEIEWGSDHVSYHIKNIRNSLDDLKDKYTKYDKIHRVIKNGYSKLSSYEKEIYITNKELGPNAKALIQEMDSYAPEFGVDL